MSIPAPNLPDPFRALRALLTTAVVIDMGRCVPGEDLSPGSVEALGELPPPVGFDVFGLDAEALVGMRKRTAGEKLAEAVADFSVESLAALLRVERGVAAVLMQPPAAEDAALTLAAVETLQHACDALTRGLTMVACRAQQARGALLASAEPTPADARASSLTVDGPGETAAGRPPIGAHGAQPPG